mmetsp:Transcript_34068/g.45027  ORF Transcript_34068/g.45027 Transcript_34068/m.45027 type:complete len:350 (-) Transcript_34068:55-1104(-)
MFSYHHHQRQQQEFSINQGGNIQNNDIEIKICRICMEHEGADGMIAPCKCTGTQRWVHRNCLDRWRSTQHDRAFANCTECQFQYKLILQSENKQNWRQIRFNFFIFRDSFLIFLGFNALVGLVGWAIQSYDTTGLLLSFSSSGCLIPNDWYGDFLCQHVVAAYYIWGFFVVIISLGMIGSTIWCFDGCGIGFGRLVACDCWGCLRNCNSCGRCCWGLCACLECNIRAGTYCWFASISGAGEVLIVAAVIAAVILALVGLFVGVLFAVAIWQKLVQRHMRILQKRDLAKEFVVMDLSGDDERVSSTPSQLIIQRSSSPLIAENGLSAPYSRSERTLSNEDSNELSRLGLL